MERSHPSSITHSDSPTQSALLPEAGRTRVVRSWFQDMIILSSLPYGLTAPLPIFQEGGEQWIPSGRSRGRLASLKLMFCLMAQPSHNSWLSGSAVVQVLGAHVPALNSPGCSSDHLLSPTTSDHLLQTNIPRSFHKSSSLLKRNVFLQVEFVNWTSIHMGCLGFSWKSSKVMHFWDFPGGPVAKTQGYQWRGTRFNSWSGNYIPHVATKIQCSQIKKDIVHLDSCRQVQVCWAQPGRVQKLVQGHRGAPTSKEPWSQSYISFMVYLPLTLFGDQNLRDTEFSVTSVGLSLSQEQSEEEIKHVIQKGSHANTSHPWGALRSWALS